MSLYRLINGAKTSRLSTLKAVGLYIWVSLISLLASIWAFNESPRKFLENGIPLGGDGASTGFFLDQVLKSSWPEVITLGVVSDRHGYPGTLDFSSYPTGNTVDVVIAKLLSKVLGTSSSEVLIHSITILKAPVIAVCFLIFIRACGIRWHIASLVSVLFALGNYNLVRSEGHFFLGLTWPVALGLAGLVYAFKSTQAKVDEVRTFGLKSSLCALPIGFSSFYYSIFLGILSLLLITFVLIYNLYNIKEPRINQKEFIKAIFDLLHKVRWMILFPFIVCLGLLYQVSIVFIRSSQITSLSSVGSREPSVAPIVYSGTLESLFFDSSKVVLSILGRQDLINFLGTRISWEGAQVGAVVGFTFYVLIFYLLLNSLRPSRVRFPALDHISENELGISKFLFWCLGVCLVLYLTSPINFTISYFLPQLRAWGRLSVFLTAITLALFALWLEKSSKKVLVIFVVMVALFLTYFEVQSFRSSRPIGEVVSAAYLEDKAEKEEVISSLKQEMDGDCSLLYVPVYPYPEFDFPRDGTGDYAPLHLIRRDNGTFKWSYPSIKNTKDSFPLQTLIEDQPDFARASIETQLTAGNALGYCGAVIDLKMLSEEEKSELDNFGQSLPDTCIKSLEGKNINEESRYLLFPYNKDCSRFLNLALSDTFTSSGTHETIFRIVSPYSKGFIRDWQMFAINNDITVRFSRKMDAPSKDKIKLEIYAVSLTRLPDELTLCAEARTFDWARCEILRLNTDSGTYSSKVLSGLENFGLFDLTMKLVDESNSIHNWSIRPIFGGS